MAVSDAVSSAPGLRLSLFGPLRAHVDGRLVLDERYPRLKVKALLAYLYLKRNRYVSKDQLVDDLWPDVDSERSAAGRLKQTVHVLRRELEPGKGRNSPWHFIRERHGSYYLDTRAATSSDLVEFNDALTRAHRARDHGDIDAALGHYSRAFALHRDDFLPEFRYEQWAIAEAETLHEAYMQALEDAACLFGTNANAAEAVRLLLQAIQVDPLREGAYGQLLDWLWRQRDHARAVRVYQQLEAALAPLDLQPRPEITALYDAIVRDRAHES